MVTRAPQYLHRISANDALMRARSSAALLYASATGQGAFGVQGQGHRGGDEQAGSLPPQ